MSNAHCIHEEIFDKIFDKIFPETFSSWLDFHASFHAIFHAIFDKARETYIRLLNIKWHTSHFTLKVHVIFDSSLSLTNHVSSVFKSAYYQIRQLRQIRSSLDIWSYFFCYYPCKFIGYIKTCLLKFTLKRTTNIFHKSPLYIAVCKTCSKVIVLVWINYIWTIYNVWWFAVVLATVKKDVCDCRKLDQTFLTQEATDVHCLFSDYLHNLLSICWIVRRGSIDLFPVQECLRWWPLFYRSPEYDHLWWQPRELCHAMLPGSELSRIQLEDFRPMPVIFVRTHGR